MVLLDVVRYIVPSCTRGPVWKLSRSPTWKMQAGASRETLAVLISIEGREARAAVVVRVHEPVGGAGGPPERLVIGAVRAGNGAGVPRHDIGSGRWRFGGGRHVLAGPRERLLQAGSAQGQGSVPGV